MSFPGLTQFGLRTDCCCLGESTTALVCSLQSAAWRWGLVPGAERKAQEPETHFTSRTNMFTAANQRRVGGESESGSDGESCEQLKANGSMATCRQTVPSEIIHLTFTFTTENLLRGPSSSTEDVGRSLCTSLPEVWRSRRCFFSRPVAALTLWSQSGFQQLLKQRGVSGGGASFTRRPQTSHPASTCSNYPAPRSPRSTAPPLWSAGQSGNEASAQKGLARFLLRFRRHMGSAPVHLCP